MEKDDIDDFLSSIPGKFRTIEEKIHPEIFFEFYNYLEGKPASLNKEQPESQKSEFVKLALEGDIISYRKIENLIANGNLSEKLKDFGMVALNHCRMMIENDLLDESEGMVSGGLGGTYNKLRYFVALAGKDIITLSQFDLLKKSFTEVTKQKDSILEESTNYGKYVTMLILGSFDYAIGDIIESGINSYGFIYNDYYVTNVEIPAEEDILKWMHEM